MFNSVKIIHKNMALKIKKLDVVFEAMTLLLYDSENLTARDGHLEKAAFLRFLQHAVLLSICCRSAGGSR
jgi:hypothetical protein